MESEVRIKATCAEIYDAFKNNQVLYFKFYELEDKSLEGQIGEDDVAIFRARIRHREIAKELQNRVYTIKGLEKAILNAPTEKPKIQLVKVLECITPYYGNKHLFPYGTLLIRDENGKLREVKTQEEYGETFIKVNGFTYYIKNLGLGGCKLE